MRPSHPCLLCGHPTLSDCQRSAQSALPAPPMPCPHCGCHCQSGTKRISSPGGVPHPAGPGEAPTPGAPPLGREMVED